MADDLNSDERERLGRLRDYLQAGGSPSLPVAAAACGLRTTELDRWLQEGRLLSVTPGPPGEVSRRCSVCGHGSRTDVCETCRARLLSGGRDDNPSGGWRRHEAATPAPARTGTGMRGRVLRPR